MQRREAWSIILSLRTFWGEAHSTQPGIMNRFLRVEKDSLISNLLSVISNHLTTGSLALLSLSFFNL